LELESETIDAEDLDQSLDQGLDQDMYKTNDQAGAAPAPEAAAQPAPAPGGGI